MSAWWSDANTFTFGANLPMDTALLDAVFRWPAPRERGLAFQIPPADSYNESGQELTASFMLPANGDTPARVIARCASTE